MIWDFQKAQKVYLKLAVYAWMGAFVTMAYTFTVMMTGAHEVLVMANAYGEFWWEVALIAAFLPAVPMWFVKEWKGGVRLHEGILENVERNDA